jgi:uncharacterized membrane protein YheB (UPF0754 family)
LRYKKSDLFFMSTLMFWMQPLIAAFTGWVTTWIAIKMLFHPRNPVRVLGITIQGVFPKRQQMVAAKLGSVVAKELIHFDEIATLLKDKDRLAQLNPVIEKHLDNFLMVKLKEKLPVMAMFVSDAMMGKIKEGMMEEISNLLPEIISKYADSLSHQIDIEKMVTDKVSNFSTAKLEEILESVMKKEFLFLEVVGFALGLLIGIIQLLLSLF